MRLSSRSGDIQQHYSSGHKGTRPVREAEEAGKDPGVLATLRASEVPEAPGGAVAHFFRCPSRIVTGRGCSSQVGALAATLGVTRMLLVTDPNVRAAGGVERVCQSLADAGVAMSMYEGVVTEPVLEYVDEALAVLRGSRCDGVIAVGGGSPIDTAKAVAALATNGGRLPDYQGIDRFRRPSLPLLALPTTAGTGSEVTRVAVVTDRQRGVKMMLMSDALLPQVALDDPLLTISAPPGATAAAGIDALTHAIEAFVSRRAQPLTDALALAAIQTIAHALPAAWQNGADLAAREQMMTAQLQAGLAFSNSSVALVHGMARPLGAHFGVPHGLANAMLLPVVMRFSLPGTPTRYARVAEALGIAAEAGEPDDAHAVRGAQAVDALARRLRIPTLAEYGVDAATLQRVNRQMAHDALESGSPANNPRLATADEICRLYEAALHGA